jgi:hypothetical protein
MVNLACAIKGASGGLIRSSRVESDESRVEGTKPSPRPGYAPRHGFKFIPGAAYFGLTRHSRASDRETLVVQKPLRFLKHLSSPPLITSRIAADRQILTVPALHV